MKSIAISLVALLLALNPTRAANNESPTRVAIIAPEQPDIATLLTARMANQPGIELIERDQVQKIVREHTVPINTVEGAPAFGKLLGADYLVFLEGSGTAGGVTARLVWCEPGAVLNTVTLPKKADPAQGTDWLAAQIFPLLHKAPLNDVRRISLLGLRCVTDSAENRLTERELNAALSARLEADPDFVVLERWHMNDLVFEKSLNNISDSPFWLAADVVDGSITPSGGKVRIHIRIRKPGGGAPLDIQCEGTGKDPGTVADLIVDHLRRKATASIGVQDAAGEAESFFHEGAWLLAHNLPDDAAQALESAWALGRNEPHTAAARIKAYAECAYPHDDYANLYPGDSDYKKGRLTLAEMPRRVRMACQALYLAADYMDTHGGLTSQPYENLAVAMNNLPGHPTDFSDDPAKLGVSTLYTGLRVLRAAHETGFHLQDPGPVAELRQAVRDNIDRLRRIGPVPTREMFLNYLAQYAGYWNESPQAAISYYREILVGASGTSAGFSPFDLREELAHPYGLHPPLLDGSLPSSRDSRAEVGAWRVIDWSRPDQTAARQAWNSFLQELVKSKDPLQHIDGLVFTYWSLSDPAARAKLMQQAVDFIVTPPGCLADQEGAAIFVELEAPLSSVLMDRDRESTYSKLLEYCISQLPVHRPIPGVINLIHFLTPMPFYTRDDAASLLATLRAHQAALPAPIDDDYSRDLAAAEAGATAKFPDLASQPPAHALHVTRLWTPRQYAPDAARGAAGTNSFAPPMVDPEAWVWAGGKLLGESFYYFGIGKLWTVHLPDFATEASGPSSGAPAFPVRMAVLPEKLYCAGYRDSVWEVNRQTMEWRKLNLPLKHYGIDLCEGALWAYFGPSGNTEGDTGLYRVDLNTDEPKLIFSTRRSPAVHPLDSSPIQSPICLLPSGNGWPILGSFSHGVEFDHTDTGKSWTQLPFWTTSAFTRNYDGGTLLCETLRRAPETNILSGVVRVSNEGMYDCLIWNPKCQPVAQGIPVWHFPADCGVGSINGEKSFSPSMSGDQLYLLVSDRQTHSRWGAKEAILYCFRPGQPDPVKVPLVFDLDESYRKFAGSSFDACCAPEVGSKSLLATPEGLVISTPAMWGAFWFVPRTDVETFMSN